MQWARRWRMTSRTESTVSPSSSWLIGVALRNAWIFCGVSRRASVRYSRGARPSSSRRAKRRRDAQPPWPFACPLPFAFPFPAPIASPRLGASPHFYHGAEGRRTGIFSGKRERMTLDGGISAGPGGRVERSDDRARVGRGVARQRGDHRAKGRALQQPQQGRDRGRVDVFGAAGEEIALAAYAHEAEAVLLGRGAHAESGVGLVA